MSTDYLKRILTSKVYDVAFETPLEKAPLISHSIANTLLLKREDTQPVFSFKLRGAYNKMANLETKFLKNGVIAASAGNHAQGVALAARKLDCKAVIVMPTTTPKVKIDAVRRLGSEVILVGESFTDAYNHAKVLEETEGLTFIHPFDDPDVIAGQGTIAVEILRQFPGPIEAIFVAIGGGGLIAGISTYIKQLRPEIKIIGVQTEDSDAMLRSIKAGKRIQLNDVGLFPDGTAVKLVGSETFKLVQKYVDEFVIVNTDSICAAIKDVFQETRSVLEPAGAMSIAAARKYAFQKSITGKTLIAIACGANINFEKLRFISDRADVGEMREALFAVSMPEQLGSFRNFCELLGERHVTEFNYRISNGYQAHVFVGLQISSLSESEEIARNFRKNGFDTLNLSNDEMAKTHLRHMIGGKIVSDCKESLYRLEFPEKPGALMRFLNKMNKNWNVSLFHYRYQGTNFARILIGIQIPKNDEDRFKEFLIELGYPYWNENNNPAYFLFL